MKSKRYTNIDLLRILACFMVVFLHVASMDYFVPVETFTWRVFNFCHTVTRSCVPLFVMISGMMIISKEEYSLKKLFTKSLPRLVFVYILWSFLYTVDELGPMNLLQNFDLKLFLKTAWNYDSTAPHLWYMPMFICLYLLAPVMHAIRDKKKILQYIIALFLVLTVLRSVLAAFPETYSVAVLMTRFDFPFAAFAGYFVLGYVIYIQQEKFQIKTWVLLVILAAVIGLTTLAIWALSVAKGAPQQGLADNFCLPTFLEACIIFLLFLRVPSEKIDATWNKSGWVQKVSKYTLFVYLLHPFILTHLETNFGITTTSANALITMPLISVGTFLLCMGVAFLIDLIPGVRKVLL